MGFAAAIAAATIITVAGIFSVYKIFLDKPAALLPSPSSSLLTPLKSEKQTSESIAEPSPKTSPQKPSPLPSSKSTSSPKPSSLIKILENNTINITSGTQTAGSAVSGLIDISGTPPSGSSIVILGRKNGSGDSFQTVADGVSAHDSANWSWGSAQNGTSYDIQAVLKGKSSGVDIDYAKSQVYTLSAPSSGQILVVDIGYTFAAPTGSITITCSTHYSNNTWSATVNFPQVSGALMYKLQIGTTSGGKDIADISKNAQTQEVTINDNVYYYARYAVASVSNPTDYQYSEFSTPKAVKCP